MDRLIKSQKQLQESIENLNTTINSVNQALMQLLLVTLQLNNSIDKLDIKLSER